MRELRECGVVLMRLSDGDAERVGIESGIACKVEQVNLVVAQGGDNFG